MDSFSPSMDKIKSVPWIETTAVLRKPTDREVDMAMSVCGRVTDKELGQLCAKYLSEYLDNEAFNVAQLYTILDLLSWKEGKDHGR